MPKLAVFQDDELYLVMRNKNYCLHGTFDGRRIRRSGGTKNLARAKLFLENIKRELVEGWREDYDRVDRDWKTVAKMIYERQKSSAFGRGIPFDLNPGKIYTLMKSTGFRCAVSGIPFAKRFAGMGKRDPWAPSLDRIENRHGYSLENVRVVCLAANIAMSDWGFDALFRLSRGIHRSALMFAEELTPSVPAENQKDDKPMISLVKSE
jgi:hypothetical protein